ncbi:MAG: DUF3098 domain-containing protein [Cytophagales bacterium]|jgi:hypothetical protein|nr:DUF3098 domain-containing protein [Cytophagales bacterium]
MKTQPNKETAPKTGLAFGRENYILMLAGLAVITVGFIVMSMDSEPFGFGFLGLTLGPIIVLAGFVVEFFAILRKPKKDGGEYTKNADNYAKK